MPKTKTFALFGLAAAALAAVVGLMIALSDSPSEDTTERRNAAPVAQVAQPAPAMPKPRIPAPRVPVKETTEPAPEPVAEPVQSVRQYVREDGVTVRDHRPAEKRGPAFKRALPAAPRQPRRLERSTYTALRTAVRPEIEDCAKRIGGMSGEGAAIRGKFTISVESGRLTIRDVDVTTQGIDEGRVGEIRDCVVGATRGLDMDASGEADIPEYSVSLPVRVGRQ